MTDLILMPGLDEPQGALDEVLRVRVDSDLLARIDRVEALMRGNGRRDVNRSFVVRASLKSFLDGLEKALPELTASRT